MKECFKRTVIFVVLLISACGQYEPLQAQEDTEASPPPFGRVPDPTLTRYPPRSAASDEFIGHRFVEEKGQGWGWVKRPRESWHKARWVALKEDPFGAIAPGRARMPKSTDDHNMRYRLWGAFWDRKVYDPKTDEFLEVFILDGWEVIGPDSPPDIPPGPQERTPPKKRDQATKKRVLRHGIDR
ncbi:MAG: hypothetical protein NZM04_08600 [Methylacidiphilales bacterium]|nr:hypothetical protein [Candidatus Methylacidiphilales bacterium]MDW8349532.1 hypothetical protein [Verrucomicrobiae bacterium]